MDVRKRHTQRSSKVTGKGDADRDPSGNVKAEKLDRSFTRFIVVIFAGIVFGISMTVIYPEGLDAVFGYLGIRMHEHAVVIDAGSTGSRVLAFSFRRGAFDRQLHLIDELWREVKPGVSSYADNPKKAAESINQLLDMAKARIPKEYWSETPVLLKATAGLRLLPSDQADAIIVELETALRTSGFKPETPLVEIMNPRDEGLYAWFTVNFLLDIFSSGSLANSFASLDLGGGSTQITFAPSKVPVPGLDGRKHFMHDVTILGKKNEVYVHSYLGLGLMAARKAIFTHGTIVAENNKNEVIKLTSPCIASSKPQSWSYGGTNYLISSPPGEPTYKKCFDVVREVVNASDVHVPVEMQLHNVAAFSYFYDRAVDSGILPAGATEGSTKIKSFIEAAKKACYKNVPDDAGFLCVDLTFIVGLLMDGYGLKSEKEIQLFKKINGHEASWALGVAYSLVE